MMGTSLGLTIKNLFFPIFCKHCGERLLTDENGFFCAACWESSPRVTRPFCSVCGRPHGAEAGFGGLSNFPCARCLAPGIDKRPHRRIYGAAVYQDAVEEAIKLFKFHDRPRLAGPLGELMRDFAEAEIDGTAYDLLVPVPLYRVRLRDRGYNQALLLAREVAPAFPQAAVEEALVRTRPTQAQSRLKGEDARRANVRGAFAVASDRHVRGKRVLLIDDVATTAGTASECARVLKRAKAAAIDVFVAALAVPTQPPAFRPTSHPPKTV